MDFKLVYMTFGSKQEARAIGKVLLEERLAAGVNIIEGVNSLYMWQGAMQDEREVVMIAKTTAEHMPALIDRVRGLHSYECPCIISLAIEGGYQAFLDWIRGVVR